MARENSITLRLRPTGLKNGPAARFTNGIAPRFMKVRLRNNTIPGTFTTARPPRRACYALAMFLLASGCTLIPPEPEPDSAAQNPAHGAETTGQDNTETGLMAGIAAMQAGETRIIGGMTIEAGQAYFAASGRLCKYITRSEPNNPGEASTQLACQDTRGWFLAPDIFTSAARGH